MNTDRPRIIGLLASSTLAAVVGAVWFRRSRVVPPTPPESETTTPPDRVVPPTPPDGETTRSRTRQLVKQVVGAATLLSVGALLAILVLLVTGRPNTETVRPVTGDREQTIVVSEREVVVEVTPEVEPATSDRTPAPAPNQTPAPTPGPEARPTAGDVDRPDPVRITIPAIGVDAHMIPLGVTDATLHVPDDFSQTGWWQDGPEPGEVGPAVVVGHVDSFEGPAVFFRLRELKFNDRIRITRGDGSRALFAVRTAFHVDKDAFPTEEVYGTTDDAQLRLITCHGDFVDGSYRGNYVVTAELVEETEPDRTGIVY